MPHLQTESILPPEMGKDNCPSAGHGINTSKKQTSRVDSFENQKFTTVVASTWVAI
jgi:hypothetical protein